MAFSDEDKILIRKSLYLKGYTAKRLTDEFREKSWTKHGVNKLLKKLRGTGTADRQSGSGRPRSARTEENSYVFASLNTSNILSTHKYTQHTQLHAYIGIKLVHSECNMFAFSSISAEYLQKI